jgi:hypothetical protein
MIYMYVNMYFGNLTLEFDHNEPNVKFSFKYKNQIAIPIGNIIMLCSID